jgi:hypothetical protein
MDACAKHRLDEEKVLWVVNDKKERFGLIFGEEGEIGFFWG